MLSDYRNLRVCSVPGSEAGSSECYGQNFRPLSPERGWEYKTILLSQIKGQMVAWTQNVDFVCCRVLGPRANGPRLSEAAEQLLSLEAMADGPAEPGADRRGLLLVAFRKL